MDDSLVAFRRARLDEAEEDCRTGPWPRWDIKPSEMAARIKQVLVDVESKRQIIEWATDGREDGLVHANGLVEGEYDDDMQLPDQLLRLLALPYAGHPAYRAEWRP